MSASFTEAASRPAPQDELTNSFYYNHDAIGTSGAVLYLLASVLAIYAAICVSLSYARTESFGSVTGLMFGYPLLGFSVLGILLLISVYMFWKTKSKMSRILSILEIGLITFLIVSSIIEDHDLIDRFSSDRMLFSQDVTTTNGVLFYGVAVLTMIGVTATYMNGSLRTDMFKPQSSQFWAWAFASFFVACGSLYVASLAYRSVSKVDALKNNDLYKGLVYALIGFGLIVLLIFSSRITSFIVNYITGTDPYSGGVAVDPGAAAASERTKQMIRMVTILMVVHPFVHFFTAGKHMEYDEDKPVYNEWISTLSVILLAMPILGIIGVGSREIMQSSPSVYLIISNVMIATTLFVIGTNFISWNFETVMIGVGLCILLFVMSMFSTNSGSNLLVAVLMSFSLISARFVSVKVLENAGDVSNIWRVTAVFVPALVISLIWFFRSWRLQVSYTFPMMFILFVMFHTFVFFDPETDSNFNSYSDKMDMWANIGTDMIVTTSIVLLVTSMGNFSDSIAERTEFKLNRDETPITKMVVLYAVYGLLAYLGTLLYNFTRRNTQFVDYVVDSNARTKTDLDALMDDLKRAADWDGLKDRKSVV